MNILLVEDEVGIREGLAAFLQLEGHIVRVADSCASGEAMLEQESFDLVVTDWRLGDGTGEAIVERSTCPVVVMTGYPQDVTDPHGKAVVLCKPVTPQALRAEVEKHAGNEDKATGRHGPRPPGPAGLDELSHDVRNCFTLACAIAGDGIPTIRDDGDCVVLEVPLERNDGEILHRLQCLGGDLRVLNHDGPRLELRLFRDAHPVGSTVVRFDQPWPAAPAPVAVDLDDCDCHPEGFVQLVEDVARATRSGRTVHILNIPPHHRLYLEILGLSHLLPNRPKSGPRLPEVLMELWREK